MWYQPSAHDVLPDGSGLRATTAPARRYPMRRLVQRGSAKIHVSLAMLASSWTSSSAAVGEVAGGGSISGSLSDPSSTSSGGSAGNASGSPPGAAARAPGGIAASALGGAASSALAAGAGAATVGAAAASGAVTAEAGAGAGDVAAGSEAGRGQLTLSVASAIAGRRRTPLTRMERAYQEAPAGAKFKGSSGEREGTGASGSPAGGARLEAQQGRRAPWRGARRIRARRLHQGGAQSPRRAAGWSGVTAWGDRARTSP
ncbi:hypothetical protein WME79_10840 [Sorangium sp. So ce726]|uniref:hypothetical protein n=1 Tax=Sorangium sp. So ce726 TaxID=3133319 RepID=UPI003F5FCCB9